jgi:hypothetical protein
MEAETKNKGDDTDSRAESSEAGFSKGQINREKYMK